MHARRKFAGKTAGQNENTIKGSVPDAVLKQARKSGQLNLSNRELKTVPDKVWKINQEIPEEERNASLDSDEKWWNQTELNKLILASNQITSISSNIQLLQGLVVLDLHDNEITSLPEGIGELNNLKRLNLSYNKLTCLPNEIGNLTALVSLMVQHNQLKELVENIGKLDKLEELDVSNNLLETLSSSLGSLTGLRKLNASHNSLRNFPEGFAGMSVLCEINFSNNKLENLPKDIGELGKLERFDCRYNHLSKVPILKSCTGLKELYVGYNHIANLNPEEIVCLSSVMILDLRDNKIARLPKEITTMSVLERLDLSNNNLSELPYRMGNMSKLKSVILDGNPLRSIRRDIIMKGTAALLEHLKKKIPVDEEDDKTQSETSEQTTPTMNTHLLSTHKKLSYSQKKAVTIPDEIWSAATESGISNVDFSKNLLEHIPLKLCSYDQTLTCVNLGSNKLSRIPPEFGLLSRLTDLDVRNNSISSLPDEFKLLTELREIILSHNRFTSLPDVLYLLPKLEVILASNNQITAINVDGILKLKLLSSLDLSNNNISNVPPELGNANSLRSLQLEGNLFRNPRAAILNKGTVALLQYLKDRIPT